MDFTGITYKNQHSSTFGIIRISDGDRYQDTLVPTFDTYTSEVPGGEGRYYLGKDLREKVFELNFAFDNVTETQLRKMKQWLNGEELGDLIFDETPYKRWVCGVNNSPVFNFVCFDSYENESIVRKYKGEVEVELISYYSYAFDNYGKNLDYYRKSNLTDGILDSQEYIIAEDGQSFALNWDENQTDKVYSLGKIRSVLNTEKYTQTNEDTTSISELSSNSVTFTASNGMLTFTLNSKPQFDVLLGDFYTVTVISGSYSSNKFNIVKVEGASTYYSCSIPNTLNLIGEHSGTITFKRYDLEETLESNLNIWDDLNKNPQVVNINGDIQIPTTYSSIEQYTTIASAAEVIKIFEFMGQTQNGQSLYDNQQYYFSCNLLKNTNVSLIPDKVETDKHLGIYFRDIVTGEVYPFIAWENWNLSSSNMATWDDTSVNSFLCGSGTINLLGCTEFDYNNIFNINTDYMDSVMNPKYELVGYGIPVTTNAVNTSEGITISDIKIIKKNNTENYNNVSVPYCGRPNVSYSEALGELKVSGSYNKEISSAELLNEQPSITAYSYNLILLDNNFDNYPDDSGIIYDNFNQEVFYEDYVNGSEYNRFYFTVPTFLIDNNEVYSFGIECENLSGVATNLRVTLYDRFDVSETQTPICQSVFTIDNSTDLQTFYTLMSFEESNLISLNNKHCLYFEITSTSSKFTTFKFKPFLSKKQYWTSYSKVNLLPNANTSSNLYLNNEVNFWENKILLGNQKPISSTNQWEFLRIDTKSNGSKIALFSLNEKVYSTDTIANSHFLFTNKTSEYNHGECFYEDGKIVISMLVPNYNMTEEEVKLVFTQWMEELIEDKLTFYYLPKVNSNKIPQYNLSAIDNNYGYIKTNGLLGKFQLTEHTLNETNIEEWAAASNLPEYSTGISLENDILKIGNYGDIATDWIVKIDKKKGESFDFTFTSKNTNEFFRVNYFNSVNINSNLMYILKQSGGEITIDSKKSAITYKVLDISDSLKHLPEYKDEFGIYFTLESGNIFKLKENCVNNILIEGEVGIESVTSRISTDKIEYNFLYY